MIKHFWRNKWAVFGLVLVLGIAADQWSKLYAESRLATISRYLPEDIVFTPDADAPNLRDYLRKGFFWSTDAEVDQIASRCTFTEKGHPLGPQSPVKAGEPLHIKHRPAIVIWQKELVLTPEVDAPNLRDYLREELSWSTNAEVDQIASRLTFTEKGRPLGPQSPVKAGEPLHIERRTATVIEGYFDFIYARNPGAAWSFMADQPEWLRKTFFRLASLLALGLIVVMLLKTTNSQWRMVWGLSLVASGAVGNLIDRLAYGYVIDFIVWHVDDAYWPTFNIADAWIAIGVGFMFLEFIFAPKEEPVQDSKKPKESIQNPEGPPATPASSAAPSTPEGQGPQSAA